MPNPTPLSADTGDDVVFIENLKVDTVIGICDWEKDVAQSLFFDVKMRTDIGAAAQTDAIDSALNYDAVARSISDFVRRDDALLIETLVQRLSLSLLGTYPLIQELCITLRKPLAIAAADCAGVTITRRRES